MRVLHKHNEDFVYLVVSKEELKINTFIVGKLQWWNLVHRREEGVLISFISYTQLPDRATK